MDGSMDDINLNIPGCFTSHGPHGSSCGDPSDPQDSLPEIHDNAEAAIQLQCDPTEDLPLGGVDVLSLTMA